MIQNNNTSVLPFYTSKDEQNHRRSYAYGQVYPLFTPTTNIPPFQIVTASGWFGQLQSATLNKPDGTVVRNFFGVIDAQYEKVAKSGYDVLVYTGISQIATELAEGQYYITLSDGAHTLYSDVFTAVKQISPYVMIEWWDVEDLDSDGFGIVYIPETGVQFKNRLYLMTQLGKPEYVFEEEGQTRDGYFFPEKQVSEKTYKCTILAPEYLCDVMRFIRMSDVVKVKDNFGREYDVDTFLITPKWEDQGDLASVEIEFQTATVMKKIGRATT